MSPPPGASPTRTYSCPACESPRPEVFFELAAMPVLIGVQFPTAEAARATAKGPLSLAFCPACSFIWNVAFDPDLIEYGQQYDNSLHHSDVFQAYSTQVVERLVGSHALKGKTVIDIGCGKGDFLEMLCRAGAGRGIGFDPSYEGNRDNGDQAARLTFHCDLYTEKYRDVAGDLLCSRYVLEHVPDPAGFLRMIRRAVGARPGAVLYFEVPNVGLILRDLSVWDIIYEHCSYFSPASLARLFSACGFDVTRVEETYGGQFIGIDAAPADGEPGRLDSNSGEVEAVAAEVEAFARQFAERLTGWRERFAAWRAEGRSVAAWGAGAKAVGFLNMLELDDRDVTCVVDINPHKCGKHLAGTGHRVAAPEDLRADPPDTVILMNPIYRNEIRDQLNSLGLAPELTEA